MLPSFIVIGAMKAGTSSLYNYLGAHPEICMSSIKETNFFIREARSRKLLESYEALFQDQGIARGEASPNYAKRHLHPNVPARIHELIPDVKLIYLVRDPIDRLVSHYTHNVMRGRERRPLSYLLADLETSNLVLTSRYFYQISAFLESFAEERILIAVMEDMESDRRNFLRRIYEFLGVDCDFQAPREGKIHNSASEKRRKAFLAKHVSSRNLQRWIGRAVPASLLDPLLLDRPMVGPADRERLTDHLAPDVELLRRLTGQRFERWSL